MMHVYRYKSRVNAVSALRSGLMRITAYPGRSGSKPIESRPHWCTNAHTHGAAPRAKHVTLKNGELVFVSALLRFVSSTDATRI